MASLRGVLARGITRNFSRGIRGGAAAHYHQYQFLDIRNFTSVTNSVNSESDFFFQLEKDRKVSILGIEWKLSFDQVMKNKFKGSNLPPLKPPGYQSDPTEHQIDLSASSLIKSVDKLIEDEPSCDILYGAMYMVYTDSRLQTYDEFAKMKVLSKVLDFIEENIGAEWREITLMRGHIKSSTMDGSKDILSEEQVESRVIDVVKSYPTIRRPYRYKITRSTHFYKHLKLDHIEHKCIIGALETEFKMCVPLTIDSCERAIDYIYHNQEQRMSLQEFRDRFCYANRFKERLKKRVIETGRLCLDAAPTVVIFGTLFFLILNRCLR